MYFIFGQKNGVSLTESSLKDPIVKNILQELAGMSMFVENYILNTIGRSYLHDHKKRFHCWFLQKPKPDKNYSIWADFLLWTGLPNTFFEPEMHFTTLVAL